MGLLPSHIYDIMGSVQHSTLQGIHVFSFTNYPTVGTWSLTIKLVMRTVRSGTVTFTITLQVVYNVRHYAIFIYLVGV